MFSKNENRFKKNQAQPAVNEEDIAALEGEQKTQEAIEAAGESDFEKFLKQVPDAEAGTVIEDVLKSGDFSEGCFTRQYVRALKDKIEALKRETTEEAVVEKALESKAASEAVVREYLKNIAAVQAKLRKSPAGSAPVVPPARPKTISEAGILASDIFKK